jgi:hypothetical protein
VIIFARAAIKDAAVAALADFPLEVQLKVAEFLACDEIVDLAVLRQHSVSDAPAHRQAGRFPAPPRIGMLIV